MRLIRSVLIFALVAGGIGITMQAQGSDSPTGAFLATTYAAISGNADALFGNISNMMSPGGGPSVPRANIQTVESEGAFLSAVKSVSSWFGTETDAAPRVRPLPRS